MFDPPFREQVPRDMLYPLSASRGEHSESGLHSPRVECNLALGQHNSAPGLRSPRAESRPNRISAPNLGTRASGPGLRSPGAESRHLGYVAHEPNLGSRAT